MNMNTMEGLVEASLRTMEDLKYDIPSAAFEQCVGIVILEAVQVGFLFSGNLATGLLLRHNKQAHRWSPPVAVGVTGVGAGLLAGVERKHVIMFLTDESIMHAMASDFSMRIGIDYSSALGPLGVEFDVTGQLGTKGSGFTYGFTNARGLYMGLEITGAALAPRTAVNRAFYKENYEPKQILFEHCVNDTTSSNAIDPLHVKLNEMAGVPHEENSRYELSAQ